MSAPRALLWLALLPVAAVWAAAGDTSTALDTYLHGLNSLQTRFTQKVSDAKGNVSESGSGTLVVQRPGKFRWDYIPDGSGSDSARGQLLVSDGKNLWFYDRELAQVSVKPVRQALSSTPVVLLSGTEAQLRDSFDVSAGGTHDGLDWVTIKPRSAQADFTAAQLGFDKGDLSRMLVSDRLGQSVQLDFSHGQRNAHVDPETLQFKAPAGVDVIGTPQP